MTWKREEAVKAIEDFLKGRYIRPKSDLAGASLLSALGYCWSAIRDLEPELPEVVLVACPAKGSATRALGHFAPLRWRASGANSSSLHEVVVTAEYLDRGPEEILATLLHEAAHAINYVRRVADCSKSQYHNKKFEAQARRLGLAVQRVPHYGLADTRLAPGTAGRYSVVLNLLGDALIHRQGIGVQTPTLASSRNLRAMCHCGFLIRVARSTLEKTTIKCAVCGQPFSPG